MIVEVIVPSPGESIKQVQVANWLVASGDYVEKDQEVVEIDSDKASLAISASEAGKISFTAQPGDVLPVGAVICTIDTGAEAPAGAEKEKPGDQVTVETVIRPEKEKSAEMKFTPLARKVLEEKGIGEADALELIRHSRVSKKNIEQVLSYKWPLEKQDELATRGVQGREVERKKISTLRQKLSERLVSVKNQTAMLTTFNEVDMSEILAVKTRYNDAFKEKFGISIGLMSFFTKAVTQALGEFPQVNSQIDGDELVIPSYVDVGIAVSAPKGLVVPVIRNAEGLKIAEIEQAIRDLANKARNNKITLDEMTGGTFTISNGGVFGSMMSTPILNPPQAAILGMHAIIERPVAIRGQVVIRPMMYLALSYDHRIIDGKESVSFLVRVKEILESPARMLSGGRDPMAALLGL